MMIILIRLMRLGTSGNAISLGSPQGYNPSYNRPHTLFTLDLTKYLNQINEDDIDIKAIFDIANKYYVMFDIIYIYIYICGHTHTYTEGRGDKGMAHIGRGRQTHS